MIFWIDPPCFGQENYDTIPSPVYFGSKFHYGFIIPHVKELKPVSEKNIWGFQFDISRLSISPKAWSNCNCYYRVGFSFDFFNYRNPEVLGQSYNLILFFEPYFNFRSPLRLSLRGGMGLNYLNKVYDEDSNPDNLFYSAPISGILLLNLALNYIITENYQANLAMNYNHISNGGQKLPNKGMNFPTLSIGMDFILHPVKLTSQSRERGLLDKKIHPYTRLFWTLRTVDEDENYPEVKKIMIGIEGGIIKGLSNIDGILIGIESIYDGSYQELDRRLDENYSPFVLSLHAGHVFVIGRITFTQQMAWYTFASFPDEKHSFFQRYGIYYRIGKLVSAGFSLKAHGHVAEHLDLRFGLQF
jgi:hypothetical protein